MVTFQPPYAVRKNLDMTPEPRWRTSSRCGGGDCVEVAALPWRTSSRSASDDCVEVAPTTPRTKEQPR